MCPTLYFFWEVPGEILVHCMPASKGDMEVSPLLSEALPQTVTAQGSRDKAPECQRSSKHSPHVICARHSTPIITPSNRYLFITGEAGTGRGDLPGATEPEGNKSNLPQSSVTPNNMLLLPGCFSTRRNRLVGLGTTTF